MLSQHCWAPTTTNYELIAARRIDLERCVWRFTSLNAAAVACATMPRCGSVVRDSGLRCGGLGVKMHYELRSSRVATTGFTSWALLSPPLTEHHPCVKSPKLPPGLKLTPREEWLQSKQDELRSLTSTHRNKITILVSGTLRGFRKCIPALRETIITPSLLLGQPVQLIISTYDRNDCGGSFHTHGLGPEARPVTSNVSKAYQWNGVRTVVHVESYMRIEDIKRLHPKQIHPVFVRYHSQFFLRSRAMRAATEADSAERIFVVLRPDAYLFGRWVFYSIDGQQNRTLVSLTLRDGSVCNVTLSPSSLLVPWSDIHNSLWDDTLAIGYGYAMRAYIGFHELMPRLSWHISEKVEHKIERYLRDKFGVRIVYACGASRGDMLKLVKSCDA